MATSTYLLLFAYTYIFTLFLIVIRDGQMPLCVAGGDRYYILAVVIFFMRILYLHFIRQFLFCFSSVCFFSYVSPSSSSPFHCFILCLFYYQSEHYVVEAFGSQHAHTHRAQSHSNSHSAIVQPGFVCFVHNIYCITVSSTGI